MYIERILIYIYINYIYIYTYIWRVPSATTVVAGLPLVFSTGWPWHGMVVHVQSWSCYQNCCYTSTLLKQEMYNCWNSMYNCYIACIYHCWHINVTKRWTKIISLIIFLRQTRIWHTHTHTHWHILFIGCTRINTHPLDSSKIRFLSPNNQQKASKIRSSNPVWDLHDL